MASLIGVGIAASHELEEPFAEWFQSLQQPVTGISCCSSPGDEWAQPARDCEATDERFIEGRLQMRDPSGEWLDIPADKVIHTANPVGRAVLCIHMGHVMCAVPSSET